MEEKVSGHHQLQIDWFSIVYSPCGFYILGTINFCMVNPNLPLLIKTSNKFLSASVYFCLDFIFGDLAAVMF